MEKYEVILSNEKISMYRRITLLLTAINTLFFLYFLLDPSLRKTALLSVGVIVLFIAFSFYRTRKAGHPFFLGEWVFFLIMLLWIQYDNYWLAALNMALFLLCTAATDKATYEFTREGIRQKNFPWRKYQWGQMENIILKADILTMNFKNNRFLQATVESEIEEKRFNPFVANLINTAGSQNELKPINK